MLLDAATLVYLNSQSAAPLLPSRAARLLYTKVVRDRVFLKRWGVVDWARSTAAGSLSGPDRATPAENGIDVIVDLNQPEPDNARKRAEWRGAAKLDIERTLFPLVGDGTGDIEQYALAISAWSRRRANEQVLVHCSAERIGPARGRVLPDARRGIGDGARRDGARYRWTADDEVAALPQR
ncbi:MAG: hypothetical protein U0575_01695 [Phycisphaerales bacterium]